MELKELVEKTLELFKVGDVSDLGDALMKATDREYGEFEKLVDGDLSKDWLQMIYQYYLADRKGKKQDYTPASIGKLASALLGDSQTIVDICAGSGALTIQDWVQERDAYRICVELDDNVVPFLLFNLAFRNIHASVIQADALNDWREYTKMYKVERGEKYGKISTV